MASWTSTWDCGQQLPRQRAIDRPPGKDVLGPARILVVPVRVMFFLAKIAVALPFRSLPI
jgi:hypothetical protein